MITDTQMHMLRRCDHQGAGKELAAAKAGMDPKTARKYRRLGRLPSEVRIMDRDWLTRPDPFAEVWPELQDQLRLNPGLEAKTLFADLQRRFPGRFADGQLRTLQRRCREWRALEGPAKEVFFAQVHHPGRLCASDFTHCTELGVTINGIPFPHLIYHFVLTYSNWETGTICFSESFESLSEGLQNALWELGGVPACHRTDRLTAAVQPGVEGRQAFKQRYQALLTHYGLQGQAIQAGKGNENGDVEQSHRQFKRALDQALMLRGSRDFVSREAYDAFLRQMFEQCNAGRRPRLAEELPLLRALPGASPGGVQTRQGACGLQQHDSRGGERLLGEQPVDWRVGRGTLVRRACRGLVRAEAGGAVASAAWSRQTQDRVSARHRLAGAQAGRVCRLPLSRGLVPEQPLPRGVRSFTDAAPGACGQGISAHPAVGGARERERRGGGAESAHERGVRATDVGGGDRGVAEERWALVAGSDGGARGPGVLRRLTRKQGGE